MNTICRNQNSVKTWLALIIIIAVFCLILPGMAEADDTFRVTEYYIPAAAFTGTTYELTLNQNLVSNHFILVRGSAQLDTTRGADDNYARVDQLPSGMNGELGTSSGANKIRLSRYGSDGDWVGVVTVVECLGDPDTSGFKRLDVLETTSSGTATSGTDTSGTGWSDINQVVLFAGPFGAGSNVQATDTSAYYHPSAWTRWYPSGSNTINWARYNAESRGLQTTVHTVYVVEWGSEWNVQRVLVTGTNGGDGADATGEYNTTSISSVVRANTWVWGTGYNQSYSSIGEGSEAMLVTLGDGVNQNTNETSVAVGSEYTDTRNFDVYTMTHSNLAVDYRFKADGNSADNIVDITVDSASSGYRMGWITNGCNGTGEAFPRPIFAARYTADTNVQIERGYDGQNFPDWVEGIDFSSITYTAGPSLTLANHGSGQVSDKFTTTSPVTDVLFQFNLTRSGTVTVDNVRVNFTTGSGVANNDVSSGELWEDVDNDGVVDDPGDTLIQGSVTPSSGVLTFTTNFGPGTGGTNYLVRATVSNLAEGDTTTFSVGTADIDEVEGGVTESGSISNATHTQDSAGLTLANHGLGQVSDKFTTTSPVTDVLFRFNLTRTLTVTVDTVRVNFTTGGGVANGDVSSGELWEDMDNDGVVDDPGDTQIQGSVTPSSGVLTFTTNFTPGTGGTNYLVQATVSSLTGGDTTTFSVGTADIDEVEGGVTESGSISNATHTQDSAIYTEILRPIGVGSATNFTPYPNTGEANWEDVDEETQDGDTTYVSAPNVAVRDTYAIQDHSVGSGTINSVTTHFWCARVGSAFTAFNPVMRTYATDYLAAYLTVNNTQPDYLEFTQAYTTNPNTGSAWTWAEVDAMEVGQENYNHASWGTGNLRVTQVYVVVEYTTTAGPKNIYYSVGTSTSDLKNASNITISGGTATFTAAQDDDVGVGDVITYDTDKKAYISGRTSSTVYTVKIVKGGTPSDVTGVTVNSIHRVFNTLSAAVSDSSGSSYLDTSNLVTEEYQLNWVCYNDATFTTGVTINGYTTDATHYIKLTVADAAMAGATQRHDGTAGTGVKIDPTTPGDAITVSDTYTVVEWFEIADFCGYDNDHVGVLISANNVTVRNNIIHDDNYWGQAEGVSVNADYAVIYNNIIYGGSEDANFMAGIRLSDYDEFAKIYNNTIYDAGSGIYTYWYCSPDVRNNLCYGNTSGDFVTDTDSWDSNSDYNFSKDDSAPGSNSIHGDTDGKTADFVSTTEDSENLHLQSTSDAIDMGTNLSGTLTDDIDGETRSGTWDIGADENVGLGLFLYRKKITIDHSKVGTSCSSELENFPVLINITADWLKTTTADPTNGRIENEYGYDIIFRDSDGKTQLDHEIELYDGTNGKLVAWVRIPTLSHTADTDIYIYYGNDSITSSTENVPGVWDTNYKAVWHLKEDPSGAAPQAKDSTSNDNDGTTYNLEGSDQVQGQIDGSLKFDGVDEAIGIDHSESLDITGDKITLEVWMKAASGETWNWNKLIHKVWQDGVWNPPYILYELSASDDATGYPIFCITTVGPSYTKLTSSQIIDTTNWWHIVGIYNGSQMEIFINGISRGTTPKSGNIASQNTTSAMAFRGDGTTSAESFDGIIDEVRISDKARDACWIETCYNNQSNPSAFYTVGDEEDLGECSYSFYKQITIQSSQVGTSCSSDLSDFPMLVSLTGNWLKTTTVDPANGRIENTDGYDIIFRDIWGTLLDHEIEQYDGTNGKLVAWVRIPTLECDENTVIYMYYGNSCISSSTENASGVWSNGFDSVFHLTDDFSGSIGQNATPGGNPIATSGASCKIGNCYDFDGDDYAEIDGTLSDDTFTLEVWAHLDTVTNEDYWYGVGDPFCVGVDNSRPLAYVWDYNYGNIPLSTGQWYYFVYIVDAGSTGYYVNATKDTGLSIDPGSVDIRAMFGATQDYTSLGIDGRLDEFRVSTVARDLCWLQTCYNNQNSPSSFYDVGNEEEYSPTAVKLVSFTATGQGASVLVEWETAQEINNLGFNLYRSTEVYGSYTQINSRLIPGLISSVSGQQYTCIDKDVTRGVLYYYMLEDVDLSGIRTMHGPVCVDWDADGIPDDYDEQKDDDDSDEDTGEEDPEVEIPLLELYEVNLGSTDWTPSGSSSNWVKLESFRARQEDEGVALEWETSYEVDNLGFHVYREVEGKFYRITPDLVPGSVFKVGAGRALPAGESYVYWDGLSNCAGHELYWLDSVELNGGRASFGPIKPEIYGQPVAMRLKARFRSIAEYQISRAKAIRKIRELREELNTRPTQKMKSQAIFYSIVPVKPSEPRLPPSEEQWALSAQPGVKIYIKEEGWYRVGEPELVTAGLGRGVDPRYLQLYADGEEQSMMVTGSEDGQFDPDDTIEFYGTGLDTPFTDAHVYWLVVGSRPGRRLDTPFTDIRIGPDKRMRVPRGLRGRGAPLSFPYTVELKERTFYFAALKNGERESFFGSVISTEPVDQLLTVAHPDPSPPEEGMLEVVLQGATDFSHQIKIQLNYVEIGQVVFSGQELWRAEIPIPQGYLLEGDNIITLAAQGGSLDVSLVDYIRLTYWRTYTADEDSLRFKASGGEWLSIGGFSSPGIRVLDITDPLRMLNVRGKVKTQDSGYAITFKVPMGGERTLLVFTEEKINSPAGMAANLASSWHVLGQQGAEVIIIGHRDLLESVRSLRELREQQGWSVVLVDVEDLYDEFNFGAKSPWALKGFLAWAYEYWNPQPRFLLLVGDTSYDPRSYLGLGDFDLVPTKFVDTEYLKTASDDWFVDFNDDGLPEMAVGRLPVGSAEEGATVVSKIISYEGVAGLMDEVLLVADVNAGFDYESASAEVKGLLPGDITVSEIFRGQSPTARSDLLGLLNQGQLLVNYIGHGSTKIWKGNLLSSLDAWSLNNSPYLPFLVNMTCLNGFFQDPASESIAEAFLKAERGGAVAVWTSSGLTYPGGQIPMNKELIQLLFYGQGLTIGEAVMGAKQAVTNRDIRRTWILFGDPITRLR